MTEKELIGGLSALIGVVSGLLYLWQIVRRTVRPHVFSWIIWGLLMGIGFAAQYAEKSGPGAWSLGVAAVLAFIIAGASFFHGEKHITRSDWAAFFTALLAIPAWLATSDPLWAVVIISIIDVAAFYPTFRKSWLKPREEGMAAFFLCGVQFFLVILALEKLTLTTVLYPAVVTALNILLVLMLLYRRFKNQARIAG